jgi:hypothetical protein
MIPASAMAGVSSLACRTPERTTTTCLLYVDRRNDDGCFGTSRCALANEREDAISRSYTCSVLFKMLVPIVYVSITKI